MQLFVFSLTDMQKNSTSLQIYARIYFSIPDDILKKNIYGVFF